MNLPVCSFLLLILCSFGPQRVSAQDSAWVKVDEVGLEYALPSNWSIDPFVTSSVCDCPGVISLTDRWNSKQLGMVTYPTNQELQDSTFHLMIWNYLFVMEGGVRDTLEIAGITFERTISYLKDYETNNIAWRLKTIDEIGKKQLHYNVYFWAKPGVMKRKEEELMAILNTFKRRKVKHPIDWSEVDRY